MVETLTWIYIYKYNSVSDFSFLTSNNLFFSRLTIYSEMKIVFMNNSFDE